MSEKKIVHRPIQRVNPNIEIYFGKINAMSLPAQDKELLKKAVLDQFLRKNESIVLEEEEVVPDE